MRRRRARELDGAAVELEAVRRPGDTVGVVVPVRHRVGEHQVRRARAARIRCLAHRRRPRRAQIELEMRRARHGHVDVEHRRHVNTVARHVEARRRRRRGHRHARQHRGIGRRGVVDLDQGRPAAPEGEISGGIMGTSGSLIPDAPARGGHVLVAGRSLAPTYRVVAVLDDGAVGGGTIKPGARGRRVLRICTIIVNNRHCRGQRGHRCPHQSDGIASDSHVVNLYCQGSLGVGPMSALLREKDPDICQLVASGTRTGREQLDTVLTIGGVSQTYQGTGRRVEVRDQHLGLRAAAGTRQQQRCQRCAEHQERRRVAPPTAKGSCSERRPVRSCNCFMFICFHVHMLHGCSHLHGHPRIPWTRLEVCCTCRRRMPRPD